MHCLQTHVEKLRRIGRWAGTEDYLCGDENACMVSSTGCQIMSEERKFPMREPAPLVTIRSLTADRTGPVRILGIVIESQSGMAIVQDLLDDVEQARSIRVIVEGELTVGNKYMIIGDLTTKKDGNGELLLSAILTHDVSELDVHEFKNALELEREVHSYLVR